MVYSTAEIDGKKVVNIADVKVASSDASKASFIDAYVAAFQKTRPDQVALFKDRQAKVFASNAEARTFRESLIENSKAAGFSVELLDTNARQTAEGATKDMPPKDASWPFDTKEAKKRQAEAATAHNLKVEERALDRDFILIPPGEFMMGSPAEETGRRSDETLHPVKITKPFYLARDELSLAWPVGDIARHFLTYTEVKDWLANLQAKAPAGFAFRLPTEAEWEYAARAGKATPFHTGDRMYGAQYESPAAPGGGKKYEYYQKNGSKLPWGSDHSRDSAPTKTIYSGGIQGFLTLSQQSPLAKRLFQPNAWGLYDMPGRLSELVEDMHAPYTKTISAQVDPLQKSGTKRVIRGGNFKSEVGDLRSAARKSVDDARLDADPYFETVGVRLVMFRLED